MATNKQLPSQATAARYLKAACAAGREPRELRVEPDGTIRVLFSDPDAPAGSPLDEWLRTNETR